MSASASGLSHDVLYAASVSLTAVTFVSGISWGLMTTLYVFCMYSLTCSLRSTQTTTRTRRTVLLIVWITVLWVLSSLSTIANAYCALYAYSWQMDYPGGPIAYLADEWNHPMPALAYWAYLMTMWFADALMLWRVTVLYEGVQRSVRLSVVFVMLTIYVGAVASGCFSLAILSTNQTFFSKYSQKAGIPCFTLSVTLNVFAAALISIRLLSFKWRTEKYLGILLQLVIMLSLVLTTASNTGCRQTSPYTSVAAMLIESSTLYAIWSVVFIILYAINNPGMDIMLMTLCNVQVIAPLLITYRVSKGLAWERNTSTMTSAQLVPDANTRLDTVLQLRDAQYQSQGKSILDMGFSVAA